MQQQCNKERKRLHQQKILIKQLVVQNYLGQQTIFGVSQLNQRTDFDFNPNSTFDYMYSFVENLEFLKSKKYELRKDKFLMSILSNGPNNQLVDFRNSILFAIKLNRTLVIPTFFEHFTIRNMVQLTYTLL